MSVSKIRRKIRWYQQEIFKNGITLEIDGTVYQILEFQHVKPGKGAAFVRTKLKNIVNGGVVEKHSVRQKNSHRLVSTE